MAVVVVLAAARVRVRRCLLGHRDRRALPGGRRAIGPAAAAAAVATTPAPRIRRISAVAGVRLGVVVVMGVVAV